MVSRDSEFDKLSSKRRNHIDEYFASKASSPSSVPDGGRPNSQDASVGGELPPWMTGMMVTGAVGELADANPPWLAAAVESGVIFYDPEGKEVVVPSSKVVAFKAALDSVCDFEQSMTAETNASRADEKSAREETRTPSQDGVDTGDKKSSSCSYEAGQRQTLKSVVQKRYFALLRDGVDPNEAAVQAIREAKVVVEGQAPVQKTEDTPQNCGSALRDDRAEQQRNVQTEVRVTA